MNIFNIKWKNSNIIIVNINPNLHCNKTINKNNYCLNYYNEEIISINIFKTELTNKYKLGPLFPSTNLLNEIKELVHVDLFQYNHEPNIVIGKIVNTKIIENTHLQKCTVDIGTRNLEIVCGATNARTNLITVVALDNAIIPTGKLIRNGKLLGNVSNGMLCSWKELGIENETKGIVELDASYQKEIGNSFKQIYNNIN